MNMKTKYRIVTDNYAGFECQVKHWWFPFWIQLNFANTFYSLEKAKNFIKNYKKSKFVEHVEIT